MLTPYAGYKKTICSTVWPILLRFLRVLIIMGILTVFRGVMISMTFSSSVLSVLLTVRGEPRDRR